MQPNQKTEIKPDDKGRISLSKFVPKGTTCFHVFVDKNGRVIIEPYAEVPAQELWLYNNKEALEKVKRGLRDSAANRTESLGDFTQYIDDDECD